MFGDLGHGLIMASFAAWMVLREKPLAAKKSDSEVLILIFFCLTVTVLAKILSSFLVFCLRGFVDILLYVLFHLLDMEHLLWRPLCHSADGLVLHVHGLCVQ
jgi:vacuolar-type H+-ATPase subunit I/STV1